MIGAWVVFRHAATDSELKTVNLNPALSYKVSERLALGFGISAQWIEAEQSAMIDSAGACLATLTAGLDPIYGAGSGLTACAGGAVPAAGIPATPGLSVGVADIGDPSYDSQVTLDGDDWSWGWNIGVLYELFDSTRVGLSYRSKIEHTLRGKAKYKNSPILEKTALISGLFVNSDGKVEITLPESAALSVAQEVGDWTILGDVTWTRWSRFEELRVEFANPVQPDDVTPQDWDNTFRYALGASFHPNGPWIFRTGIAYDESPVPSAKLRTPRIPDDDRIWLGLGLGYTVSEHVRVDVGYAHVFAGDIDMVNTTEQGTVRGSYKDMSANILSIQLAYNFRWGIAISAPHLDIWRPKI